MLTHIYHIHLLITNNREKLILTYLAAGRAGVRVPTQSETAVKVHVAVEELVWSNCLENPAAFSK